MHQKATAVLSFVLVCLCFAEIAKGYNASGRITIGTYDGWENLAQPSAGDYSNNIATASGRFFLRLTELTDNRFEFVSDIRDKNDFFGLVDRQALQLNNSNTLQIRQLSAKYPGSLLFTELGRFSIPQAGAVYTDGALQGVVFSRALRWAIFGGLNPKRPDQTYVQYNSDSRVFGTYLSFIPTQQSWGTAFSVDTAGVTDLVRNDTDRTYWYTNTVFQWNPQSRLGLLTYLDFVPGTYLQNGTFNYQQGLGSRWLFALNLFSIDVIEYQRLQSVREQLPSSPYKEGGAKLRYTATAHWALETGYVKGHREADGLNREETKLTSDFLRIFDRHWDFSFSVGYRDDFASYDTFGEGRISYFSRLWELGLEEEFGFETYKNGFGNYHPLISEFSVSRTFDNALYGTFSYQDVHDERVQISTVFLKISYRFGSREIPPVRDGAPPRGRL